MEHQTEDVTNPKPAWVSANAQPAKQSTNLAAAQEALRIAEDQARPATMAEAVELLTPCLVLCAPSGMQQADRTAWYRAAMMAIGDIPRNELARAASAAMKACDHPAKIVPFICNATAESTAHRQARLLTARKRVENLNAPRLEKHEPQYMTSADLAELKAEAAAALNAN